jgi:hypothetical protein
LLDLPDVSFPDDVCISAYLPRHILISCRAAKI